MDIEVSPSTSSSTAVVQFRALVFVVLFVFWDKRLPETFEAREATIGTPSDVLLATHCPLIFPPNLIDGFTYPGDQGWVLEMRQTSLCLAKFEATF